MVENDLLSPASKRFRKSLLSVSAALLAVELFDITIENIPVSGLRLTLQEQFIPMVLFAVAVYLLISLGLNVYNDIINRGLSHFEQKHVEMKDEAILDQKKFHGELLILFRNLFGENHHNLSVFKLQKSCNSLPRESLETFDQLFNDIEENFESHRSLKSDSIDDDMYTIKYNEILDKAISCKADYQKINSATDVLSSYSKFRNFKLLFDVGLPLLVFILATIAFFNNGFTSWMQGLFGIQVC